MASDTIFELCLPILRDGALDDDDKTDRLEELLRKETPLEGRPLQDAILGVLWRHRDATNPVTASPPPPPRSVLMRRGSPAPWQVPRVSTPVASPSLAAASPVSSHGFAGSSAMSRVKSSTASPFTSPRPSPRPSFALPLQSPGLGTYEFFERSASQGDYGDFGSDTVDWLVNDDEISRPTSSSATSAFESNLSAAAAPWIQPQQQQAEMSPYDMLRSILGESRSDDEIEAALEANSYDLSATLMAFMGAVTPYDESATGEGDGHAVVGKSTQASQPIPIGQSGGNSRNPVLCKYWVATGSCLRADCRFSHEYGSHICKYWIEGNCLAGDSCVFSHDPSAIMANLALSAKNNGSDSGGAGQPSFQVQDYDAFPALQAAAVNNWAQNQFGGYSPAGTHRGLANASASPRSFGSRPNSRHSSRAPTPSLPQVDDNDAFPALGVGGKGARKHHGKRGGHGHPNKETHPDAVRMSPSGTPGLLRKGLAKSSRFTGRDQGGAGGSIAPPEHVPWLETGERANQAYIKARQDAFKHSGLRNKFLQSAAQAWNRQDVRAAKALSLRGQSENELMRKAHREAARVLYEAQTQPPAESADPGPELYVDLHGLHPEEAIAYLARVLREQRAAAPARGSDAGSSASSASDRDRPHPRPLYAITGTGHHSKGGKDKVGKAIRAWLAERGFAFREFSVPGDRGNVGGILGIDAKTGDPDGRGVRPQPGLSRLRAEDKGESEEKDEGGVEVKAEGGVEVRSEGGAEADEATPRQPVMEMKIPTGPKGLRT